MKKISIITLFPEFVQRYSEFGIIARAIQKRLVKFTAIDMRKFGLDKRKTVDDRPYGGGLGMVLRPDVVVKAIQKTSKVSSQASRRRDRGSSRIILLTPQGKPFNQAHAKRLTKYDNLIFVSGRYEGFDERVRKFVDEELSIGDYVLMGGELPALVISEAVLRLVPGVLGKDESADSESFSDNLLEYPQYTKPEVFEINSKKLRVPKVLLTGHHANVAKWRKEESEKRTKKRRPDLLA
ncbi:TPA: tRNA (guanosine(37)-N1)-methyltransferase TrmD [Patescibacteria group bacterium]|nr:tRNA (guanosine(37)-N1)-methyltransferase TrmD [Patescibacteria group bacterium]